MKKFAETAIDVTPYLLIASGAILAGVSLDVIDQKFGPDQQLLWTCTVSVLAMFIGGVVGFLRLTRVRVLFYPTLGLILSLLSGIAGTIYVEVAHFNESQKIISENYTYGIYFLGMVTLAFSVGGLGLELRR